MMKKLRYFLLLVCVIIMTCLPVCAKSGKDRVIDNANILSDSEEESLEKKLDSLSKKYKQDFVIVTAYYFDVYGSTTAYADDYFDNNSYGVGSKKSGMLFLFCPDTNDYAFSASGKSMKFYSDNKQRKIIEAIGPDLKAGRYTEAFDKYEEECRKVMKKEYLKLWLTIPVALIFGLILSLIVMGLIARQLKSVTKQYSATEYTRANSFQLRNSRDQFIHRDIRRHKIETSSGSSRTGSSGNSHSGISGRL